MTAAREIDPRATTGTGENFEAGDDGHPASALGERVRKALGRIPGFTSDDMRALEDDAADQIGALAEDVRTRVEATLDEKLNGLAEIIAGAGGTIRAFIFGAIFGVAVFVLAAVVVIALVHALR